MKVGNAGIGLFVIGGLALFGLGLFLIGDRHSAFAHHVEYYSEFVNLAGLANGAKVRVGGMDAGQVLAIGVPDSPSSRFRVKWRVDAHLRGLIRTDSVVTVGTEGVVGGTYLAVRPGSAQALQAPTLATIPSKEPLELSDVLERGTGLLADAQTTLKDVGSKLDITLDAVRSTVSNVNDIVVGLKKGRGAAGMLLTDDALADRIRQTINTTTADVQELLAGVKAGRGAAGMLLRDEAVAGQIRDAVKNAGQATANLSHATGQADVMMSDLNARQIPRKAGEVVDNLNESTRQIHQLVAEIAMPDQQGMSAGANIRNSLTNANTATSNLADATEALKHNFLVRGYFKKRGYYNLAEMSPEHYRREKAFISPKNRRVWLSGSDLFKNGPRGEELSERGKAVLDATFTENGDPSIIGPMIIEGYWNGEGAEDQLRFSHARATLVRQYLQARFQLDSRDLGAVALKNLPPTGFQRASWDGVCIVVLRRS